METKNLLGGFGRLNAYIDNLASKVDKGAFVSVGFLEGATYPAKSAKALRAQYAKRASKGITTAIKGAASGTVTVPMVAALNEFGVPSHNQPPRPFFRSMIAAKSPEWGPSMARILKRTNYDAKQTMALMGQGIAGQLTRSIQEFTTPGLAESTIKAKNDVTKPLIDTSHMIRSIDYEVKS